MNFYEHQDKAERRTKLIVFLFVVSVVCIVVIVGVPIGFATTWDPVAVGSTVLVCLLIIGIATLVKLSQLRGGGESVATMLGGTVLQRDGSDKAELRVQNIVEEMAIASGMPVPPVYIIEDDEINAFAAGWSTDDSVIGVTRGCIQKLSRDELQGVVAHEFSHISHGDMRINIRLIGIIFGIMVLGITGWILVRYVGPAILRTSSRSRSKEGAGGAGVGRASRLFGVVLALCGGVGSLFGRLIQASVSRQREFLADASAVQFTRNPPGIGGALRKIGGMKPLQNVSSEAGQCNHMFFSQAMRAVFASHPPISERIARVEGVDVDSVKDVPLDGLQTNQFGVSGFSASSVDGSLSGETGVGVEQVTQAKNLIGCIPPEVKNSLVDAWSARLVMFALVTDGCNQAQNLLSNILSKDEFAKYQTLSPIVCGCDPRVRLPIVDLAAPTLRTMSESQRSQFNKVLITLVKSDGVITRFEWVIVSVLQKHLSVVFGDKKIKTNNRPISFYAKDIALVLGTLAYCGAEVQTEADLSFKSASDSLGLSLQIPEVGQCVVENTNNALKQLRQLSFVEKKGVIKACEICVFHDREVTVVEAETIRAIGDILDCPIPVYV